MISFKNGKTFHFNYSGNFQNYVNTLWIQKHTKNRPTIIHGYSYQVTTNTSESNIL